jgi:hypothetical protein
MIQQLIIKNQKKLKEKKLIFQIKLQLLKLNVGKNII